MKDELIIADLYQEILEEANGSHGNQKEIQKYLDVIATVNNYIAKIFPNIPQLIKVQKEAHNIKIMPFDEPTFLQFHEGGDHHPLRRMLRAVFKKHLDKLKQIDRKYFRDYVQPILTGT